MILSVIGQPDLRLGLQLLKTAVTAINTSKAKNNFFIIFLLKLKTYYCKVKVCKDNLPTVNGEIQLILPSASILWQKSAQPH
jgi:hypothetical protein